MPLLSKVRVGDAFVDWSLFLSGYAPLIAIWAIKVDSWTLKTDFIVVAALLALPYLVLRRAILRTQPAPFVIRKVENRAEVATGYLATYLLPFLTTGNPSITDLITYAAFIWLVGVIATRGRVLYVNPFIYLTGQQIYSVKTNRGEYYLIAEESPEEGVEIRAHRLRGRLLLEASSDE